MSLPQFPMNPSDMTRDDAVNQILSSIAMEELGLSHIINAEGEKLQYVLGTLSGTSGPGATVQDVLDVNASVQKMMQTAAQSQMFLSNKMSDALSASTMQGPAGPMGPTGVAGVSPTIGPSGTWVVDGVDTGVSAIGLTGPTGATGVDGTGGGATGADGATGATGLDGATGATGLDGATGATGLDGATGATGLDGATGATGLDGATGATGLDGVTGATGLDCATGATGLDGATGATGLDGATGATGLDGATGATGATPTIGASGTWVIDGVDTGIAAIGPTGPMGATGADGTDGGGDTGADGATGATGVTGATGATGVSAIIPFASGGPVSLNFAPLGVAGTPAYVAFGANAPGVDVFGNPIQLFSSGTATNMAFTVPRAGTITDISASFTVLGAVSIALGTTYVQAQLYLAPAGNDTFSPIPETLLTLEPGITLLSVGQLLSGNLATEVSVAQDDQLLMVFATYNDGGALVGGGSINGYASAGIAIA